MATQQTKVSQIIGKTVATTLKGVQKEVSKRTYRASNELRNASLYILRGRRSGKVYTLPHTGKTDTKKGKTIPGSGKKYRASAPGESPAVRTGIFRLSWGTHVHVEKKGVHFRAISSIESKEKVEGKLLGEILEYGTRKIKPRPYKQKIIDKALPKIKEIYKKPF